MTFDERDALVLSVRLLTGLHRQLEREKLEPGDVGARAEAGLMVLRSTTRHLLDRIIRTPARGALRISGLHGCTDAG